MKATPLQVQETYGIYCQDTSCSLYQTEEEWTIPMVMRHEIRVQFGMDSYLVEQKQDGVDFINKALMNYSEANTLYTDEYISNYIKLP